MEATSCVFSPLFAYCAFMINNRSEGLRGVTNKQKNTLDDYSFDTITFIFRLLAILIRAFLI